MDPQDKSQSQGLEIDGVFSGGQAKQGKAPILFKVLLLCIRTNSQAD